MGRRKILQIIPADGWWSIFKKDEWVDVGGGMKTLFGAAETVCFALVEWDNDPESREVVAMGGCDLIEIEDQRDGFVGQVRADSWGEAVRLAGRIWPEFIEKAAKKEEG